MSYGVTYMTPKDDNVLSISNGLLQNEHIIQIEFVKPDRLIHSRKI